MTKIVFCEDDDLTRKLIRIILRDTPYKLFFASDGLEGLALVERERPALVFTDMHMQGLDGTALCAAIKGQEQLAHIPIVLMTGAIMDSDSEYTHIEQGLFTSTLAKPFSPVSLHKKIECLLGKVDQPPQYPDPPGQPFPNRHPGTA
jgi:CheY-like chemotaxis protein